ncbi:hypothetical protein [Morganella morganii]|uniref:hypothetical protein n=1 Tax=Morganella morganii TaxID=582 RepID=UPI001C436DAE|nr:hypothetical protein [Morganella morganii]QXO62266.1 hypothetical protein JC826_03395 [Morganella morganii]QXO69727.1 hypothetical protein JC792_03380 [Morganella morganii]
MIDSLGLLEVYGLVSGIDAAAVSAAAPDADAMMTFAAEAKHRHGVTAGEAAMHFSCLIEDSRDVLENLFKQGKLRKRGSRYRVKQEGNRDE